MKLSIIIPVHNNQNTLSKLMKSLDAQTIKDFNVIFVDDGSTDQSSEKLTRLVEKSVLNVVVLSQHNRGQEIARNTGVRAAKTEFVTFIDADDWVEATHVERLLELTTSSDLSVGMINYFMDVDGKTQIRYSESSFNQNIFGTNFIEGVVSGQIEGFLWNKIFRRELLMKCLVDEDLNYKEDTRLLCRLSPLVTKFSYDVTPTYHYVIKASTAVAKNTTIGMWQGWQATNEAMKSLVHSIDSERLDKQYERRLWRTTLDLLRRYGQSESNENDENIEWAIKELKNVQNGLLGQLNFIDRRILRRLLDGKKVSRDISIRFFVSKLKEAL